MKFTFEGKEYEFRGEYGRAFPGDHVLDRNGTIYQAQSEWGLIYAIVHPVEKLHIFGGVEFRETGEVRQVNNTGAWVLTPGGVAYFAYQTERVYTILEPVRGIKEA